VDDQGLTFFPPECSSPFFPGLAWQNGVVPSTRYVRLAGALANAREIAQAVRLLRDPTEQELLPLSAFALHCTQCQHFMPLELLIKNAFCWGCACERVTDLRAALLKDALMSCKMRGLTLDLQDVCELFRNPYTLALPSSVNMEHIAALSEVIASCTEIEELIAVPPFDQLNGFTVDTMKSQLSNMQMAGMDTEQLLKYYDLAQLIDSCEEIRRRAYIVDRIANDTWWSKLSKPIVDALFEFNDMPYSVDAADLMDPGPSEAEDASFATNAEGKRICEEVLQTSPRSPTTKKSHLHSQDDPEKNDGESSQSFSSHDLGAIEDESDTEYLNGKYSSLASFLPMAGSKSAQLIKFFLRVCHKINCTRDLPMHRFQEVAVQSGALVEGLVFGVLSMFWDYVRDDSLSMFELEEGLRNLASEVPSLPCHNDICFVSPLTAICVSRIEDFSFATMWSFVKQWQKCRFVAVPISDQAYGLMSHWALLLLDRKEEFFVFYDSIMKKGSRAHRQAKNFKLIMEILLGEEYSFIEEEQSFQQANGCDCGFAVCCWVQLLAREMELENLEQDEVDRLRRVHLPAWLKLHNFKADDVVVPQKEVKELENNPESWMSPEMLHFCFAVLLLPSGEDGIGVKKSNTLEAAYTRLPPKEKEEDEDAVESAVSPPMRANVARVQPRINSVMEWGPMADVSFKEGSGNVFHCFGDCYYSRVTFMNCEERRTRTPISNFVMRPLYRIGASHVRMEVRSGEVSLMATLSLVDLQSPKKTCTSLAFQQAKCSFFGSTAEWSRLIAWWHDAASRCETVQAYNQIGKVEPYLYVLSDQLCVERDPDTNDWAFGEPHKYAVVLDLAPNEMELWSFKPHPKTLDASPEVGLDHLKRANKLLFQSSVNKSSMFMTQVHTVMSLCATDLVVGTRSHFPILRKVSPPGGNKGTAVRVAQSVLYPFNRQKMPFHLEGISDVKDLKRVAARAKNIALVVDDARSIPSMELAEWFKKLADDGIVGGQSVSNYKNDVGPLKGLNRRTFVVEDEPTNNETAAEDFDAKMAEHLTFIYCALPLVLNMCDRAIATRHETMRAHHDFLVGFGNQKTDFLDMLHFSLCYGKLLGYEEKWVMDNFKKFVERTRKARKVTPPMLFCGQVVQGLYELATQSKTLAKIKDVDGESCLVFVKAWAFEQLVMAGVFAEDDVELAWSSISGLVKKGGRKPRLTFREDTQQAERIPMTEVRRWI
jgi:hypothetical protein